MKTNGLHFKIVFRLLTIAMGIISIVGIGIALFCAESKNWSALFILGGLVIVWIWLDLKGERMIQEWI